NFNCVRSHSGKRNISEELGRDRCDWFIVRRFENLPADALCPGVEALVFSAFRKVAGTEPAARTRGNSRGLRRRGRALRRLVGSHELEGRRRAAKPHLGPSFGAVVNTDVTVPITVFDTTRR